MVTPRILVTGGKGMLGSAFSQFCDKFGADIRAPGKDELDVRDERAVAKWAAWVDGGWIIHCAALVDVEACAKYPEDAYAAIVSGTRNIVELAKQSHAGLLYPQSFLIYDGGTNPILETESPRPLSRYGGLKYLAESIIADSIEAPLIVRMAGFFGGGAIDKNFVGRIVPAMFAAITRKEASFEVGTRIWQPTWTRDLAFNSLQLISSGASGMYHMASHGQASFAEIAGEIVEALGWRRHLTVVAVDPSVMGAAELGRRPEAAVLDCSRLVIDGLDFQRPWRDGLREYLQSPFFDQFRFGDGA
jgi:dTDP-4-dehydrorhamnose reductase